MVQYENNLRAGFRQARYIARRHAKTFYFASRFLPKEKRLASYAVYAICRLSDEAVDNNSAALTPLALHAIEKNIEESYSQATLSNSLLLAFRYVIKRYSLPKSYFDELLEGMRMDLSKNRYKNFEELYAYCYKVAGVVGLIMLRIFGFSNEGAEKHAIELGIAMQLTNILRDIKEDLQRGRIYLPQDEMQRYHVTETALAQGKLDEHIKAFLQYQISRARGYYASATNGTPLINDRSARLVTKIMQKLYAGILEQIEKNKYDVFTKRAHVPLCKKLKLTTGILAKG